MERYRLSALMKDVEMGGDIDVVIAADAQRALDAERARVKELEGAASTPINELLAELISCAGVFDVSTDYEDDRKALETATQAVLEVSQPNRRKGA
jgi:tRNA U34 5-carboxymethylaminomethyl modifying GTPase MnmE/TrmE